MTPALLPLTVVQVAKVSCIEEEVSSEEVAEASPAWSEGQRSVEVEASGPVAFSSQVVTCHAAHELSTSHETSARSEQQMCVIVLPSLCGPRLYILNPRMLVGPPR